MDTVQYIEKLENELDLKAQQTQDIQQQYASTIFDPVDNENLIKWQLSIKEELTRIEHLLRKHVPKVDKNGDEYYADPEPENQLFNEAGVNEILILLSWYLNKNIILSNFSEDQINVRMHQLGNYLTDFIFNNYEKMGLDNKEKIKHYPMIVMNIVNTVEAAYYRALNGGERESLRTARTVTQTEPLGGFAQSQMGHAPQATQQGKFSMFRPTSWGRR